MIALITSVGHFVTYYLLRQHSSDMKVINIASRQRMLSQKIAKSAHLIIHPDSPNSFYESVIEFGNTAALWQESHMLLLGKLNDQDLHHKNSARVKELYEIISPQYDIIREASELIIKATSIKINDSTFADPNIPKYVKNIFRAETKFLQGMDDIVLQYEIESTARVTQLKNIEILLMGALFSILLVNGLLVFRPVYKKLISAESARSIAEKKIIKLSRAVEQSPVAIIITDKNNIIEYVNPPFTKLTGYTSEEAVGKNLGMLDSIFKTKDFYEDIYETINSGKTWNGEIQNKKKNGELYWESYIISPIFDADNKIINFVAIKEDITEQKRLAEEERNLQRKLKEAERLESLGLLAGGVAHDLNNILGPILGYPDLILESLPDDSPIAEDVIQIKIAAGRAADTVSDLLALTRRGSYDLKPLNFNDIIDSYLLSPNFSELSNTYEEIELVTDLDDSLSSIQGSTSHLIKVIMNLIRNSFESMEDGGVVRISTKSETLKNNKLQGDKILDGKFVLIEIEDEGCGITQDDIHRIFDPFFTTKKKTLRSGTGLGLSVVNGIVKDLDGFINVTSQVGHGSNFKLYFPATEEILRKEQDVDITSEHAASISILLIDDDADQRNLNKRLFTHMGYKIECAENGQSGLDYLRHNNVDLILLDMIMEDDFDGLDTYEEIRKIKPEQPVIIVSGYSETERVKKAIELGVKRYVKKPYTAKEIVKIIRETLDVDAEEILESTLS